MTLLDVPMLMGAPRVVAPPFLIEEADAAALADYRQLRRRAFVDEQGLFAGHDRDDLDDDPRTVVLVARASDDSRPVLGGVRLAPATPVDLGWWTGSRLVVAPSARGRGGIGAALVRAACASAESRGVLRFEATVQEQNGVLFDRLGWERLGMTVVAGAPHLSMRWPIDRVQRLVDRTKAYLAPLLRADAGLGRDAGEGFVGDDGSPIAGTDVIVATDAILPAMVERDPEWAGWCSVLVNVNDLSAMGASPIGIMDALGARDEASARLIMAGLQRASEAWGVPIIGGHTQLGVPASLAVTAIGRTSQPVRGGGGRAGQALTVTADLGGSWRPGYTGTQWDSTSTRTGVELQQLARRVADARPSAAKDVSMSGLVGTVGMLAEASGCGAELDIAAIPRPSAVGDDAAAMGDWLTCFPGFAMITADDPGTSRMAGPLTTSSECGRLTDAAGVTLRWPDGITTTAITGGVTGLGAAGHFFTDKTAGIEGTRS